MKNQNVFWNLEVSIKPGKLEALKTLASEMIEATQANEPNALTYKWSINAESAICHIFERYTDSDATRVHMGNFQAFADRFFDCVDLSRFQVYGQPDAALKKMLGGLGAQFVEMFDGFNRYN